MSRPRNKEVLLLFRSTLIASGANADARAASGLAKIAEELEGEHLWEPSKTRRVVYHASAAPGRY